MAADGWKAARHNATVLEEERGDRVKWWQNERLIDTCLWTMAGVLVVLVGAGCWGFDMHTHPTRTAIRPRADDAGTGRPGTLASPSRVRTSRQSTALRPCTLCRGALAVER